MWNSFCFWLLNTFWPAAIIWFWVLLFSLLLGHFITGWILNGIRNRYSIEVPDEAKNPKKGKKKVIPGIIVGPAERLFFTIMIVYDISGTAIAMIMWITIKMAQGWGPNKEDKNYAFSRLLGGMISMFFALIGGLLIRYLDP